MKTNPLASFLAVALGVALTALGGVTFDYEAASKRLFGSAAADAGGNLLKTEDSAWRPECRVLRGGFFAAVRPAGAAAPLGRHDAHQPGSGAQIGLRAAAALSGGVPGRKNGAGAFLVGGKKSFTRFPRVWYTTL